MVKTDKNIPLLILVSFMLITLDFFHLLNFIKNPLESLIIPVKQEVYDAKVTLSNFTAILWQYPKFNSMAENQQRLIKENNDLSLQLQLLKDENAAIRKQLDAPLPASFQYIPGEVLGISRNMEISVGENAGVKPGMTVVDGANLIGKIISTARFRSSVMLLNDQDMSIPAKTSRGVVGRVVGQSSQTVILDKVLQKDSLFLNDQVVTTGEENLPPNLILGKIVHITANDTDPYKQAKIEPVINLQNLKTVFVLTSI